MVGKELRQLYNTVIENGCDKNCKNCELYLSSRAECIFEAKRKWEIWAKNEKLKFGEYLKSVKGEMNVSK